MEGGVHRGRWNIKAPVGIILLLICMFNPTLTLVQPPETEPCPHGDYLTDKGICCNKCPPGFKLAGDCQAPGQRTNCTPCPSRQYTDQMNYSPNCRRCRQCKTSKHEIPVSQCERYQNTICRCEEGFYRFNIDSETSECRGCKRCEANEQEKKRCTAETNTVCECKEDYHRVNNKCELCTKCTDECKHHCSTPSTMNTRVPEFGKEFLTNIIVGGVVAVAVVSMVVFVITYMVTKRYTKKKLLKSSSQSSDDSPDSCKQVLITTDEPSTIINVKAEPPSPVIEQEQPSNLPDCVPFEIKIPDLIYTVLDLVPVLQMKQLVRSLGVTDTEIEQTELDYRSCREAHYQMLRLWAERRSRAGGMMHWPLLQELLDELRKMHLGRAAEELETKYDIQ